MRRTETTQFEDVTAQLVPATEELTGRASTPAHGLHVCRTCGSGLVFPIAWDETSDKSFHVLLRCPNCETLIAGHYAQEELDALERELDRGEAELEEDLARLTRANMADAVERFVRALEADAIQPVDF
jgi:hypothetical protein